MYKKICAILVAPTVLCFSLYGMMPENASLESIDSNLSIAAHVKAIEDNRYAWLPGNIETLVKNIDVNAIDDQQNTRLHYAVLLHMFSEAVDLINLGADATKINVKRQDPLALLSDLLTHETDQALKQNLENGYHQILTALAKQPALRFSNNETLLHKAVEAQDLNLVQELLRNAADPNATNDQNQTPLHYSVYHFQTPLSKKIVVALLEKGANADARSGDGQTAIHALVQNYFYYHKQNEPSFNTDTLEVIDTLLKRMQNKNSQDLRGNTPLYVLVAGIKESDPKSYPYRLIKRMLIRGANPNIQNKDGFTPLHAAVNNANLNLVELLLSYGANPHLRTYAPRTQQQIQAKAALIPDKTPRELAIQNRSVMTTVPLSIQLNIERALLTAEKTKVAPVNLPALEHQQPAAASLINALDELTTKLQELQLIKE